MASHSKRAFSLQGLFVNAALTCYNEISFFQGNFKVGKLKEIVDTVYQPGARESIEGVRVAESVAGSRPADGLAQATTARRSGASWARQRTSATGRDVGGDREAREAARRA